MPSPCLIPVPAQARVRARASCRPARPSSRGWTGAGSPSRSRTGRAPATATAVLTSGLGGAIGIGPQVGTRRVVQERVDPAVLVDQVLERLPEVRLLEEYRTGSPPGESLRSS